ncbi:hypothetical protein [Bradyrhizobium sp. 141]|uniref:hypothetical protein n=1 Tax=Bradyrhizobium sp. 141 TaxID=2782617 RepID=UPI001FFBB4DC|nr:hypothetical protein [Bradyrhizobium sp. 141]
MSGIGARPNDNVVQSQLIGSFDEQCRDLELVGVRSIHARLLSEAGQDGTRVTIMMPAAA